jgi:hypothetical protein
LTKEDAEADYYFSHQLFGKREVYAEKIGRAGFERLAT